MLKQQHNDLVESQILHEDCDQGAEQGNFDDVSMLTRLRSHYPFSEVPGNSKRRCPAFQHLKSNHNCTYSLLKPSVLMTAQQIAQDQQSRCTLPTHHSRCKGLHASDQRDQLPSIAVDKRATAAMASLHPPTARSHGLALLLTYTVFQV